MLIVYGITMNFIILKLLILYAFCGQLGSCFFNVEELKNVNYGIEILDKPVILSETSVNDQTDLDKTVNIASIHGQLYQCSYKQFTDLLSEEEDAKAAAVPVPKQLEPMANGPCLKTKRHWWTYEFCYGKHIMQYHEDTSGHKTDPVLALGYFESDFNWETSDPAELSKHMNKYHSQTYVNGTVCDLTGKPRKTEVRFACGDLLVGDYITGVEEHETCSYIIYVKTAQVCNHPYTKPKNMAVSLPISCSPALTQEEYKYYERKMLYEAGPKTKELVLVDGQLVPKPQKAKPIGKPYLGNGKFLKFSVEALEAMDVPRSFWPKFEQMVEEMVLSLLNEGSKSTVKRRTLDDVTDIKNQFNIDEELWQELEQDIQDTAKEKKDIDIKKYQKALKESMGPKLHEIKKEAEEETGIKLDESTNEDSLDDELDRSIDILIQRLIKAQKRLDQANHIIEESFPQMDKEFFAKAEKALKEGNYEEAFAEEEGEEASVKGGVKGGVGDASKRKAAGEATSKDEQATADSSNDDADDEEEDEEDEDDFELYGTDDQSEEVAEEGEGQQDKLDTGEDEEDFDAEYTFEAQNKPKQGTSPRSDDKIEIRIVSSGFMDSEEQRGHMAMEDAPEEVNRVIIAVLGHSDQADKEKQKQKELETGYSFNLKPKTQKEKKNT